MSKIKLMLLMLIAALIVGATMASSAFATSEAELF